MSDGQERTFNVSLNDGTGGDFTLSSSGGMGAGEAAVFVALVLPLDAFTLVTTKNIFFLTKEKITIRMSPLVCVYFMCQKGVRG